MGYNTNFRGVLHFDHEVTDEELRTLDTLFNFYDGFLYLELSAEEDGIQWNGMEKTRDMDKAVRLVIEKMKRVNPEFSLTGIFDAQGEEIGDIWRLLVDKNEVKIQRPTITYE